MGSAEEKAFPTDKATEIIKVFFFVNLTSLKDIKEQITSVIGDQNYSRSHAEQWSKSISENIAEELKKLNLEDIKFVINITLLEKTDKCCSVSSPSSLKTTVFSDSISVHLGQRQRPPNQSEMGE